MRISIFCQFGFALLLSATAITAVGQEQTRKSDAPTLSWAPPGIEGAEAADTKVACPLGDIMVESTKRVQALVDNMQRFGADEQVQFQVVKHDGQLHNAGNATFHYSAYIHEYAPNRLTVDEYRDGRTVPDEFPANLLPMGTPGLALIFHPNFVNDFTPVCEGQAEWNGRKAWRLRLDQNRPNSLRGYRVKNHYFPVTLKARAWIDSETFELLHLETNLKEPIPEIKLKLEEAIVNYGLVKFASKNLELWLPQSADVYMDYRGKKYHYRHTFSDFQLFWVATEEKRKAPKE